jgi:hypothetical protein
MDFRDLAERFNTFLYQKDFRRLSPQDLELAKKWTLQLIRDSNPQWTEEQVLDYYNRLLKIRVVAVDQWKERNIGS